MITSGTGSMSSASASRKVIGTISRTVVIEVRPARCLERLQAVPGLGDHAQVGLGVEHQAQAAPHHRMVVGEQQSRHGHEHVRAVRACAGAHGP